MVVIFCADDIQDNNQVGQQSALRIDPKTDWNALCELIGSFNDVIAVEMENN